MRFCDHCEDFPLFGKLFHIALIREFYEKTINHHNPHKIVWIDHAVSGYARALCAPTHLFSIAKSNRKPAINTRYYKSCQRSHHGKVTILGSRLRNEYNVTVGVYYSSKR